MAPSFLAADHAIPADSWESPDPSLGPVAKSGAPSDVQQRAFHEEYQYLDLIRYILKDGEHRPDR
jgi:hypothetical protein